MLKNVIRMVNMKKIKLYYMLRGDRVIRNFVYC